MKLSFNIHPILATIVISGIIILIYTSIKGCNNGKRAVAENPILHKQLDSSSKKYRQDSAKWAEKEKDYRIASELQDGQIKLHQNIDSTLRDSLDKASKKIDHLLSRYKPIIPNVDTSVTTVPNEYITDCADCFGQLSNGKELVKRAYAQRDSLDYAYNQKITLQLSRISELKQQNKNLQATLTDAFEIAKKEQEKNKQTRKLYLSGGTMAIGQYMINSIGGGLGYQDLRYRLYSVSTYGSKYGAIYMAQVYFPLSLKRK